MKNVLVVYYSQSGQLTRVVDSMIAPLEQDPNVTVHREAIVPERDYPYPWSFFSFLDAFPESVYLDPPALKPFGFDPDTRYDLVIVAYTVWFLSPSLPITGFLKSEAGRRVLKDTPVITTVACRNMWLMAQEQVKKMLTDAGARHTDHVALIDRGSSLATFFTTPRWMLTGRKDRWLGLFPPAGIADRDIEQSSRFGRAIARRLDADDLDGSAPVLGGLKAAPVDDRLIPSERIARRSFLIWGRLIRRIGGPGSPRRVPVLAIYVCFLIAMIIVVVPPSMLIRTLLRPLRRQATAEQRRYFEQPSGSGVERMEEFSQ